MNKELINKMQATIILSKFKPDEETDFADVVEHEGELFTFANADGMDMLMPYNL